MKLIGLDVGTKRIGVAKADTTTKIAVPTGFVEVNGQEFAEIARIARMQSTSTFVVGLPRNNSGEETKQSLYARDFARQLAMSIPDVKIYFEDESLTSVEAERRLKERKRNFEKGEIDAEAASIILQDFLERLATNSEVAKNAYTSEQAKRENDAINQKDAEKSEKTPKKTRKSNKMLRKILKFIIILAVLGGAAAFGGFFWYNSQLSPVAEGLSCKTNSAEESAMSEADEPDEKCRFKQFTIDSSDTTAKISENLEKAGLVRSGLAFQLYVKLNRQNLKYGIYNLGKTMSVSEIAAKLAEGAPTDNVFNLTVLPGETVADVKAKLLSHGFLADDVKLAFEKKYQNKVLSGLYDPAGNLTSSDQPRSVQLEGYIFGDTYQFYKTESLDKIVSTMVDALGDAVEKNNLEAKFKEKGLSLREGIILASIVQKEAKAEDMNGVAQVFLNRLDAGMSLGSDVTAKYAADLIDPDRKTLTSNADVLALDSLYNTRRHAGLTPGPISSPGLQALKAVATGDDSKRSMLFFLTGDDGKMYYSDTEAGHNQNIHDHCRTLCDVAL